MTRLLLLVWKEHLKRWDVWIIILIGLLMIGSFSLMLIEGEFIRSLAEFDPFINILEHSFPNGNSRGFDLVQVHIVRSGLLLFQFLTVVLLFLLILGDPLEDRSSMSLLDSYPVSRFSLFTIQTTGIFIPILGVSLLLWIPCFFNALYAGEYLRPTILSGLFFGIKLLVVYGLFRFLRELMPLSLAGLLSLLFYVLAHFDGVLASLAAELSGISGNSAGLLEFVLPPFDTLNRRIIRAYRTTRCYFLWICSTSSPF